jgi:RimJ/RimL family protein N-acetyltransferase
MIETPNLILRPPIRHDFEATALMFADPVVTAHIGGKPVLRADAWTRFLRDVGHWTIEGFGLFSIIEKSTERYVGKMGFARFERNLGETVGTDVEASWVLASTFHGQGYAREAASAAHIWFDAVHDRRIACLIAIENRASIRLAAILGYEHIDQIEAPHGPANVLVR